MIHRVPVHHRDGCKIFTMKSKSGTTVDGAKVDTMAQARAIVFETIPTRLVALLWTATFSYRRTNRIHSSSSVWVWCFTMLVFESLTLLHITVSLWGCTQRNGRRTFRERGFYETFDLLVPCQWGSRCFGTRMSDAVVGHAREVELENENGS